MRYKMLQKQPSPWTSLKVSQKVLFFSKGEDKLLKKSIWIFGKEKRKKQEKL